MKKESKITKLADIDSDIKGFYPEEIKILWDFEDTGGNHCASIEIKVTDVFVYGMQEHDEKDSERREIFYKLQNIETEMGSDTFFFTESDIFPVLAELSEDKVKIIF